MELQAFEGRRQFQDREERDERTEDEPEWRHDERVVAPDPGREHRPRRQPRQAQRARECEHHRRNTEPQNDAGARVASQQDDFEQVVGQVHDGGRRDCDHEREEDGEDRQQ